MTPVDIRIKQGRWSRGSQKKQPAPSKRNPMRPVSFASPHARSFRPTKHIVLFAV
jgi:hypothetical protein